MKKFRLIFAVIFICSAVFLTSCSSDGAGGSFACDISANPAGLDPQLADEPNSRLIASNIFMGLMRKDADGNAVCAGAQSYTVSDDGLVYDFRLREDVFWTDCGGFSKQCTARDYVFGFRRLFDPFGKAPDAAKYFCIKNSKIYNQGVLYDVSLVGVSALSDFELRIELNSETPRFLDLLCELPASPCCEEYFTETHGKYGLSAVTTPSNGAFYVRSWHYDKYASDDVNHIILAKNTKNAAAYGTLPATVKFFIEDEEDFVGDFLTEETNVIAVANDKKGSISSEDYNCEEYSCITAGLIFNKNFPLFQNTDFRKALAYAVDRNGICGVLKSFKAAQGIIPEDVKVGRDSFRTLTGARDLYGFDLSAAKKLMDAAKPSLDPELMTGARIIVKSADAAAAASNILQEWQQLGFYGLLEQLSEQEFSRRLAKGDYEIALVELSADHSSPKAFLEPFREENGGFSNELFEKIFAQAESDSDDPGLYAEAEQIIINQAFFVPIYCKNEYFFTAKGISGLIYDPFNKIIDFTWGREK